MLKHKLCYGLPSFGFALFEESGLSVVLRSIEESGLSVVLISGFSPERKTNTKIPLEITAQIVCFLDIIDNTIGLDGWLTNFFTGKLASSHKCFALLEIWLLITHVRLNILTGKVKRKHEVTKGQKYELHSLCHLLKHWSNDVLPFCRVLCMGGQGKHSSMVWDGLLL